VTRIEIAPDDEEGCEPSTPVDPRIHLPIEQRKVMRTLLPNGTVLISHDDQPSEDEA
jgi:hypothetical protein